MSEYHDMTLDEVMTEFAKRDSAGFIVWGQKLESAHKRETSDLRCRLKVVEDALKIIDNMCDGDMCKFFDTTHHCSACRYLNECQKV